MLQEKDFDDVYFGARKPHYSNYLDHINQALVKKRFTDFLDKHQFLTTDKLLELGAGIGMFGKIAGEKGLDVTCVDVSQWCLDNKVHDKFVNASALAYLKTLEDKSFDYIVSFGFLECLSDQDIATLRAEMNRVGKKEIHGLYPSAGKDYNLKTLEKWQELFGDTAVVEKYG